MAIRFRFRTVSRLALLTVLFLSAAAQGWAQTETGRLTGLVLDQTGAVLPGAAVTLTSTATGSVRNTVSDALGRYVFANVQRGPYVVKITMSGFGAQSTPVVVTVGGSATVETQLKLAGQAEAVSVVATSQDINTTNGELSSTIRQEQIRELPTLTRNAYDLVGI